MPGYDFILQAETGLMAITGEPDGESMKLGVAIVDICTGMLATISILGAMQARHAHRQGPADRSIAARQWHPDAGQRGRQPPRLGR